MVIAVEDVVFADRPFINSFAAPAGSGRDSADSRRARSFQAPSDRPLLRRLFLLSFQPRPKRPLGILYDGCYIFTWFGAKGSEKKFLLMLMVMRSFYMLFLKSFA